MHLALEARERLAQEGVAVRVVSMPSWELFDKAPQHYQDEVLPPGKTNPPPRRTIPFGSCDTPS